MALKIAHMADIHLDSEFLGLPPRLSSIRRGEMMMTFDRAIDTVKAEGVDMLIISGDLFDDQSVLKSTVKHVASKLGELHPVRVFIAPGNHDPYTRESYYMVSDWPENVHIFSNRIERFDLKGLNVSVYGWGFNDSYAKESVLEGFRVEDGSRINIMAIHGDVAQESVYNPIRFRDLESSGLDYAALGHIHTYSGLKRAGKTWWCYPGNIEGRDFSECGPRGFVMCTLDEKGCDVDFRPICAREYAVVEIDVTDMPDVQELIREVKRVGKKSAILRVYLKGCVEEQYKDGLNIPFMVDQLTDGIKDGFFYVDIVDETDVDIDPSALEKEPGIKGLYARKLNEMLSSAGEDEKKVIKEALRLGIKALEGSGL